MRPGSYARLSIPAGLRLPLCLFGCFALELFPYVDPSVRSHQVDQGPLAFDLHQRRPVALVRCYTADEPVEIFRYLYGDVTGAPAAAAPAMERLALDKKSEKFTLRQASTHMVQWDSCPAKCCS